MKTHFRLNDQALCRVYAPRHTATNVTQVDCKRCLALLANGKHNPNPEAWGNEKAPEVSSEGSTATA